jgi:hypothetical protein
MTKKDVPVRVTWPVLTFAVLKLGKSGKLDYKVQTKANNPMDSFSQEMV